MRGYLKKAYGQMQANIDYKIYAEGYDYYLFTNGTYVPKNLVCFRKPEEIDYEGFLDF